MTAEDPRSEADRRVRFEPVARHDPRVSALYRAYVRDEVVGPVGLPVDDAALAKEAPPEDLVPPGGEMVLVTLDGEPVALGGVRDLDTEIAEIKSMYVDPPGRRRGIARQLLRRRLPRDTRVQQRTARRTLVRTRVEVNVRRLSGRRRRGGSSGSGAATSRRRGRRRRR